MCCDRGVVHGGYGSVYATCGDGGGFETAGSCWRFCLSSMRWEVRVSYCIFVRLALGAEPRWLKGFELWVPLVLPYSLCTRS